MVSGQKVDKDLMRKSNLRLVLSSIYTAREISRAQVAEQTKMSIVTVGRMTDELMSLGLVRESEKDSGEQNAVGRPPRVLSLAADDLLCCGVFLEKESLQIGLVDPYGRLCASEQFPLEEKEFAPAPVLDRMASLLTDFLARHRQHRVLPVIGVVVPGIVDIDRGELEFSSNFQWRHIRLVSELSARLPQYAFVIENDIKALALAENRFGACANSRNMVVLNLGNGIGAAVILNGSIYRGKNNMAGEIGHIIINPAGRMCECGQIGCLQTNIAQWAILQEARSVVPGITLPALFDDYDRGAPYAVRIVERLLEYISIAINLLANTYSPETILLCGSMLHLVPRLRELVRQSYSRQINEFIRNSFTLSFESFATGGHLIGGGTTAYTRYLDTLLG